MLACAVALLVFADGWLAWEKAVCVPASGPALITSSNKSRLNSCSRRRARSATNPDPNIVDRPLPVARLAARTPGAAGSYTIGVGLCSQVGRRSKELYKQDICKR